MDKNDLLNKQPNKNHRLSFLKKDGFYLILFLCLCIIAGVATYVNTKPKSSSAVKQENKVSLNKKKVKAKTNVNTAKTDVSKDQSKNTNMDNANLAKNNASVSTSAPVVTTVVAPIKGVIAQAYTGTDGVMAVGLDKVSRTILGEYIKVDNLGIPVYSSVNGTVSVVESGRVTILSNDKKLKIIYDNLNPSSIKLKTGDAVKQNDQIAVVGDSDNAKDRIVDCNHLYFEIDEKQQDGSYRDVNPQNYIKY